MDCPSFFTKCQFKYDTARLNLWKELHSHLIHVPPLLLRQDVFVFVMNSDINIQAFLPAYLKCRFSKHIWSPEYTLLVYFLILYLKTCLIIYEWALTGVFFCFKELIQNENFKEFEEPGIWLSLRVRSRLREGSYTWSKLQCGHCVFWGIL